MASELRLDDGRIVILKIGLLSLLTDFSSDRFVFSAPFYISFNLHYYIYISLASHSGYDNIFQIHFPIFGNMALKIHELAVKVI